MNAREFRIKQFVDPGNTKEKSEKLVDNHMEMLKIRFAEKYLEYKLRNNN